MKATHQPNGAEMIERRLEIAFVGKDDGGGPLFVVRSGGDDGYLGEPLLPCLSRHVKTYELEVARQYRTIEGLASHLIRVMRSVKPTGPYRVAGCGLSGFVAYEIATQLLGDDEDVEFLALITGRQRSKISVGGSNGCRLSCESSPGANLGYTEVNLALKCVQNIVDRKEQHREPESGLGATGRTRLDLGTVRSYSAHPLPIPIHLLFTEGADAISEPFDLERVIPVELRRVTVVGNASRVSTDGRSPECLGRVVSLEIDRALRCRRDPPKEEHNFLFTIQTGDPTEVPIVCIPGAGDNVATFLDLAAKLGERQPVYSIQPRGYFPNQIPHSTVSAASKAYIREIEENIHSDRIDLVGHSYGGWIAFEMSLQLLGRKTKVRSLSILDSKPPCADFGETEESSRVDALMKMLAAFQMSTDADINVPREALESTTGNRQISILHSELVKNKILPARSSPNLLAGQFRAFAAAIRSTYVPSSVYEGETHLVIAETSKRNDLEARRHWNRTRDGWAKWASRLRVNKAPGNHVTMLKDPQVTAIASFLRPRIAKDMH